MGAAAAPNRGVRCDKAGEIGVGGIGTIRGIIPGPEEPFVVVIGERMREGAATSGMAGV